MEAFWEYWYWWIFAIYLGYTLVVLIKSDAFSSLGSIVVHYTPPHGINVLEAGVLYDRFTEAKDFMAAVLELKRLGFITIEKKKSRSLYAGADTLLRRTDKKSESLTTIQRYLLDEKLFSDPYAIYTMLDYTPSSIFPDTKRRKPLRAYEVWQRETYFKMVKDFDAVSKRVSTWTQEQGYMKEDPKKTRSNFFWITLFFIFIIVLMIAVSGMFVGSVAFVALFFIHFPLYVFLYQPGMFSKIISFIPMALLVLFLGKIYFGDVEAFRELVDGSHIEIYLVIALIQIVLKVASKHIGMYTAKGRIVRRYLRGFEVFLKRVKKDEIERFMKEDKHYFDEIYPYIVMFGILQYNTAFSHLSINVD